MYYYLINNVNTNQFVDMPNNSAYQGTLFENYNINGKVTVLPITIDNDVKPLDNVETHLIYIVDNNIATPVLISYVTTTAEDGSAYMDVVCRNLNDGSLVDYEKINFVS